MHAQLLASHFYDVKTATTGLECVSQLKDFMPDVVVLHRELSWGGGDGVLAWMRDHADQCPIPVILTTNATPGHEFSELTQSPVVRCLRSPCAFTVLLEAIGMAITTASRAEMETSGA